MKKTIFHIIVVTIIITIAPHAAAFSFIYWGELNTETDTGFIYRADASGFPQALVPVDDGLRGIAIDTSAGKVYWTDVKNNRIQRANIDGSNVENIVMEGLEFPRGIALDTHVGKMFWGDQLLDQIMSFNLDGSDVSVIISKEFHVDVVTDILNKKLYWTETITSATGNILKSDYDGLNIETVLTGFDKPAWLALDIDGGKIYWSDYVVDVIRRANLDGTAVEDLYVVGDNLNPRGIALDLKAGKVYWAQANSSGNVPNYDIMRMNLDGSNPEVFIPNLYSVGSLAIVEYEHPNLPPVDSGTPHAGSTGGGGSGCGCFIPTMNN